MTPNIPISGGSAVIRNVGRLRIVVLALLKNDVKLKIFVYTLFL